MVRVRKERGTEFGRETSREGEERKGTFSRAPLFSPSRQLVMYVKLRQPWTSSCSLLFPSRARNLLPLPSPSSLLSNACHVGYFLRLTTCLADLWLSKYKNRGRIVLDLNTLLWFRLKGRCCLEMLKEAVFIGHFEAQGKLGDVFHLKTTTWCHSRQRRPRPTLTN